MLIITGRGRGSEGGIPVVRPTVARRLSRLRRQGVVSAVQEHTPGSFVVTLAPVRAMLAAVRRKKDPPDAPHAEMTEFATLDPVARAALESLAAHTLDSLGVAPAASVLAKEMARQLARLSRSIGDGPHRARRLRDAIVAALDDVSGL